MNFYCSFSENISCLPPDGIVRVGVRSLGEGLRL